MSVREPPISNTVFNVSDFTAQDANATVKWVNQKLAKSEPSSLGDVGYVYRSTTNGYSFTNTTAPFIDTYFTSIPLLNEGTYILDVTVRMALGGTSSGRSLEFTDNDVTVDTFSFAHSYKSHDFSTSNIVFMKTSKHVRVPKGETNQQNLTIKIMGGVTATLNTYLSITRVA